jgi:hypothetical protein
MMDKCAIDEGLHQAERMCLATGECHGLLAVRQRLLEMAKN